jgi:multidrug efflux system membrane fusion protein
MTMSVEQVGSKVPPPVPAAQSRPHWGLRAAFVVVLALAAGALYWFWQPISSQVSRWVGPASDPATQPAGQGPRGIPVVAATARRGDLPIYLNGLGTVTAFNSVVVRTRVDGQLDKVAFTEGQMVAEGDLLCQIDPRPFEVQLTQAQGQLAKDDATLRNAKLDLARYMGAGDAASQMQRDTAAATVAQAEGAVKTDQGVIDNAKLQLTYCRIIAPFAGRIGLRTVDQGNMVHAADVNGLAVITQIEPISIKFSLPQDSLPQIQKAMAGGEPLPGEAYNRDLKTRLATGSLAALDNQIDPSTGMVSLKAVFPNKDHALFPNQFVNVRLLVDTKKGAVLVPAVALQRSPQQTMFVYVVKPDDTVEIRTIKPGPTEGETASVAEGLSPGEVVVTDGVDKLVPGIKVAVRPAGGASSQPGSRPASQSATQSSSRPSTQSSSQPEGNSAGRGGSGGGPRGGGRGESQ